MHPSQIALVQDSFALASPSLDHVIADFYRRLFERDPALRGMFPSDLAAQRKKLAQALSLAVNGLSNAEKLLPILHELGARHVGYGVTSEHYTAVGQALIDALASAFGEAWTHPLAQSWQAAYGLVANTMQAGADMSPQRMATTA